jgi:hypothetical protein
MVSEKEVEVLRTGVPVEGTTVWLGNSYGEKAGRIRFLKLLGDCQF